MGWAAIAGIGGGALGLLGAGTVYARRRKRLAAQAAEAQEQAQPAESTLEDERQPLPFNPGKLAKDLKELGAGGVLGTIGAGLTISDLAGRAVEAVGGGEGKGDLVRVGGAGLLLPVLVDVGIQKGLDALGIDDPDVKKGAGQLGVAGALGGLPGLVGVGAVKGVDALLGVVSEDAQRAVHNVLRPLDPTNPSSAAGKAVGAVAEVVSGGVGAIGKAIGGLVGGGPSEEELAARKAAEEAAARALAAGVVTIPEVQQAVQTGVSGGLGGLITVGKALADKVAQTQPQPIFTPAIVPAEPPAASVLPVSSPPVQLPPLKLPTGLAQVFKFGGREEEL